MDTSIIHLDDLFDVAQPPKEPDRYERWVNKLREMLDMDGVKAQVG